jgi:ATP-dependent metalloprotease
VYSSQTRSSLRRLQEAVLSTAYHEAGHALVALYTPGADPLHKATINPRGAALGLTWQIPPGDEHSRSLTQMRASIDVAMGGTVAERIAFGQDMVGIGATSDLAAATNTARFLVCDCGFSDAIGPMKVGSKSSSAQQAIADQEASPFFCLLAGVHLCVCERVAAAWL